MKRQSRASWNRADGERSERIEEEKERVNRYLTQTGGGIDSQVLSRPKVTMCIDVSISLQSLLILSEKLREWMQENRARLLFHVRNGRSAYRNIFPISRNTLLDFYRQGK